MATGPLGSAADFAVLGAATVTNTGTTTIVGNVGVSPGTAITGFPPGVISGGTIHAGDAVATQAHADLVTAYGVIAGEAFLPANNLTNSDLGGLTLTPGVYHFDTAASLDGILTLDAQGDPNARFDFQIGLTLTTASESAVHIINGGQADNVYFQVGSSATLGTDTAFQGNILADQSVTLTTGASMSEGRALALVGAVTMDTNQVSAPEADVLVTKTAPAGPVLAGNTISYTINVSNAGPNDAQTVALSDLIPANTTFVSDTQTSGPTFTLTNPAVGGTGTISGTINLLASEVSASFTVVILVSPSTPNGTTITNTANVTSITSDPDLDNNTQTVTTNVATQADLSVTKTTAAGPVVAGNTITYTITVANAGPSDAQTVALSDLIPANTTFVSDAQMSGPAFTLTSPAVGGTGTISGTIGTLALGASASFTVVVMVPLNTPNGTTITNTADVNVATSDPNLANNSATVTTSVLTPPSSISGTVFLDLNATGTIAVRDPGMAGRVVFIDLHGDGILHNDDPQAVTDASGNYTIGGLIAGQDVLRVKTFPNDDPTRPNGNHVTLNVTPNQNVTGANFGLQPGSSIVPRTPTPTPFLGGTTTQGAVIESIYRTLLGRQGQPAEIQFWVARVQAGESYANVATDFLHSTEYRTDVIDSYYETFLGRSAESAGVAGWMTLFQAGWTETQISEAFVTTTEYNTKHADPSDYVESLYANVLGRDATPAEITLATHLLSTGTSRIVLAADVIQSTEAYLRGIDGDYTAFLARVGETSGVAHWLTLVQQGTLTLAGVEADFFNTPEFISRATIAG